MEGANLVVDGDLDLPLLHSFDDELLHLLEGEPNAREVRLTQHNNRVRDITRRREGGDDQTHTCYVGVLRAYLRTRNCWARGR